MHLNSLLGQRTEVSRRNVDLLAGGTDQF